MTKPNCYECKHRRNLPGDAHSECVHPSITSRFTAAIGIPTSGQIEVVGNEHGREMGWFFWPLNYDPLWLVSCTGFEALERKDNA